MTGADAEVLVLAMAANGRWAAFDTNDPATPENGIPVFDTDENPIEAGWHTWRSNYSRDRSAPDWQSTGLRCETTHLN